MSESTYQHWKPKTDAEGLLWLHLDQAAASANVLSAEVLTELNSILDQYTSSTRTPPGIIFLSDKPNGFIAGADINEFTKLENKEAAFQHIRRGQAIMDRIESLPCPTIALIHGFCLGGGMELALACHYRIADDGIKTKLGLPEVQLGIHPGFGGTVRLPRLVGAPAAMDLILTGKTINAKRAKKIGMIDYAVPTRQLIPAVKTIIMDSTPPHQAKKLKALTNSFIARPLLAYMMRKKVAKKANKAHYPAPYAVIDLWEKYGGQPQTMMTEEAHSISELIVGDTAQNLVRVFFLRDKLKTLGKLTADENFPKVQNVHVIGAGVMGGDIAIWCALHGLRVTLQDQHRQNIANVKQRAFKFYNKKLRDPRLVTATLDRLIPDLQGGGIPRADLIIEAIVENAEAKQNLYRDIEPKMKPGALLTTNTSSIPLEVLGEGLSDPSRIVGLHFFNPATQMPLIEIVTTDKTDATVTRRVTNFATQIDRLPLPVKSTPGFLVNRILMPYLLEAVRIHEEGTAAEHIDKAALDFGMPMGPLHLADTVGLDICLSVAQILAAKLDISIPSSLETMVQAGNLGAKSGKGFYTYKQGKPEKQKLEDNANIPSELIDRLIGRLLNEAVACLREGVVENEDFLDAGIIFGTGFAPFRGGPLNYAATQGINTYVNKLHDLEQRHGDIFKADDGWSQLAPT